ncbi:hypothetical protein [Arthrobacter sp. HLT1-21]
MTDPTPAERLASGYGTLTPARRDGSAPPVIESAPALAAVAAMWTPEAQARYKHLSSLPDGAVRTAGAGLELGYLESAKSAAEQKEAN